MKQALILLITLSAIISESNAFSDFKDFIVTDKYIWALTTKGKVKLFNKSGERVDKQVSNSSEILILSKDNLDNPIILDKNRQIKKYDELNNAWQTIASHQDNCYGIVFNSKNVAHLITDRGIRNLQTDRVYFSNASLNHQIKYKGKWSEPSCYFIDKKNRIWIGFGYGEWGGDLIVFDTERGEFQTPKLNNFKIELWPVKSFFEDSSSVYLSAGLQHMMTSGIIVRFDDLHATILLESRSHLAKDVKTNKGTMISGEYIGPGTYNKVLNTIYFYSQNGIFAGDVNTNLAEIDNWKLVINPTPFMSASKMVSFKNGGILFLSENEQIGHYDGKRLLLLD